MKKVKKKSITLRDKMQKWKIFKIENAVAKTREFAGRLGNKVFFYILVGTFEKSETQNKTKIKT